VVQEGGGGGAAGNVVEYASAAVACVGRAGGAQQAMLRSDGKRVGDKVAV
jgi:hypothetical protein